MPALVDLRSLLDGDGRSPHLVSARARAGAQTPVREAELAELRAFCGALDLGSISRAARLLHVSQPTLSKRLRGLEAVAGTKLLERSPRGVTATAVGDHLYSAASRLLADADAVEAVICEFWGRTAPVRVAASPTIAEWWLPQVMTTLHARHERHLAVELITANSTLVRRMVREGHTDVGLAAIDPVRPSEPGPIESVIWENEVIVAVPAGHPWAQAEDIDPEEFARTAIIRRDPEANSSRVVDAALDRIGLTQVTPIAEIGSTSAAIAIALSTGVPVVVPAAAAADHELVIRRVRGVPFQRQFTLVLGGRLQALTPPARAFAQYLLEVGSFSA